MKKELGYFTWNAFLALSLIAAKVFSVGFPVTIVGIFAGAELALWIIAQLCLADKDFRDIIRKNMPPKWWRIFSESAMVIIAGCCGNNKIAVAWVMIAALAFYVSVAAQNWKEKDEKPADAA